MFRIFLVIHTNIVYAQMEKKGGGVSLYVKKSIYYKVRTKLAFQTNDFESLVIEFDKNIFSSKKNIIVCIFYRSPNSSLKLFNEKLDNILDIIHREKKYCYIIGDFNVNCISDFSDVTLYSQQFINMFLSHYYQKTDHYTHKSHTKQCNSAGQHLHY